MRINKSLITYTPTSGSGSGTIKGSGTANFIPKFTASDTIGDSIMVEGSGLVTTFGASEVSKSQAGIGQSDLFITNTDTSAAIAHQTRIATQQVGSGLGRTLIYAASYTANTSRGELSIITENGAQYVANIGTILTNADNALSLMSTSAVENIRLNTGGVSWLNGGNIGIGNNNPSQKIDITGRAKIRSDISTTPGLWLTGNTGSEDVFVGLQGVTSTSAFGVYSASAWRFTILNGGNVGIGTQTPTERLDVVGNINLSGNITTGNWRGVNIPVTHGGTGVSTLTGVVIGNGASNFSAINGGPLQLLRVNASATGFEFFSATFLTNPMVALGDIIYGAGAGTPTRLAGNSTNSKMFLSSTGSGGSPTAPQWETIEFTEIGGTLAVGQGGTGATSLSGVLVGNGTSAFTAFASTTPQQLLRVNTLGTGYEWFSPSFLAASDINATTPLVWNSGTRTMSIPQANNTTNGFLSSADWLTFSSKQPAITLTTTGDSGASTFNVITGALNIPEYTLSGLGGFVNPMTTWGDLIIARTSGAPFRFAGNSTTTRRYLSQIGDGTQVTSTSWEAITAASLGAIGGSGTTNVIPKFTSSSTIGNSILSESSNVINIGDGGSASEYGLQIGANRTGNGFAYIDLVGDATYTNFGMRLIRLNSGSNSTSAIEHRGTGDFLLSGVEASRFVVQTSSTDALSISTTRQLRLHAYTSTTSFTGTAVGLLAYDAFGQVITQSNIPQSGNYTPTLYAVSNVSGTTAYNCQYIRVGSVVSVSGRLEVDATTASTLTIVEVELPYNTTFANAHQCNGVLTAEDNICGIILASTSRATLRFTPPNTGSFSYFFTLHFEII